MGKDENTASSSRHRDKEHHRDRSRERERDKDRESSSKSQHYHHHKHRDRSRSRSRDKDRDRDRDSDRKHKKRRKRDGDPNEDDNNDNDDSVGGDKAKHKKKKHKHHKRDRRSRSRSRSPSKDKDGDTKMKITDDDANTNDADMWFEKDLSNHGERVLATDIPTAESLNITSSAESRLQRDEWMMAPQSNSAAPVGSNIPSALDTGTGGLTDGYGEGETSGGMDFFASLGRERQKKPKVDKPDPDKPLISSKELNLDLKEGRTIDHDTPPPPSPSITPGGPGSSWRMMRLRRVYETAEEEGRPIEEVGVERFGSLQAFNEAREERRILDERNGGGGGGHGQDRGRERDGGRNKPNDRPTHFSKDDGEKRFMFTDTSPSIIPGGSSGGSSRSSSFRRPGGAPSGSGSGGGSSGPPPVNKRLDSLRLPSQANSRLSQSHTPIPSVLTPPPRPGSAAAGGPGSGSTSGKPRALSPSSLNRLQAKVIRAKLMGTPDAEKLEKEYEEEARRAQEGDVGDDGVRRKVEVLPTLDGRGRMYDVGYGRDAAKGDQDAGSSRPGNRRKKEEKFETHDRKTGEVIRINADDDELTLGEMLRQERMGAGMSDQKDLDAQYAKAIMGDGKFENDLNYIDDNAEKLGRQRMRSDAMKRQFAINDYKRTQKALASCQFCYGEDDSPPKAPVIATGTRVYLSCTLTEELVPGHCLIVPMQHHLNMLEGDDDVWDETRNFMKCLMRMFAAEDKGVVFFETVISLRRQKHTCIECVPVPWEQFDVLPGYFKESILASEAEWSQHKKLIDFSARPGGFRRAMVPNLPYFMVQFDHKGEKGYGHVIEGAADGQDEDGLEEGEKGGGEFPRYFAGEIIGNVLELDGRRWRRPKRIDVRLNGSRVGGFRKNNHNCLLLHVMSPAPPSPRECLLLALLFVLLLLAGSERSQQAWNTYVPAVAHSPQVQTTDSHILWGSAPVPETDVVAHVPGWTVFDKLYIHKGIVYIVSSNPDAIPDTRFMYSKGLDIPPGPDVNGTRLPTDKEIQVISPKQAHKLFGSSAQIIDGATFFVNDPPQYITHYYHWSAELWYGFWRTYSSLDPSISSNATTSLPPIRRILFNHLDNNHWRDYASMNQWVIFSSFPSVTLEFIDDWRDRAEMGRPFVFERVVLADRSAAMQAFNYARYQRTAAAAFALPGNAHWWQPIRNNVIGFAGLEPDTGAGTTSTPVITYISRQHWGRRMLIPEHHDKLVEELYKLRDRYGYEVNIVEAENMSRLEQIRLAARTTIMMGVHGNGLTSLLWMNPTPRSTVMEFFYPTGFAHDYEYTTRALGMTHYGFWNSQYFTSPNLPPPSYPEGFQGNSIPIDGEAVARLCVQRLSLESEVDD